MSVPLRLGTRGSPLALWQARHIAELLRPLAGPRPVELVLIETTGDRVQDVSLATVGGQGVFTKEIQRALLDDRVDLAVHSLKDLPTVPVEGLLLVAVPPRGPVGDVLVSPRHAHFDQLPRGARLATGSLRRQAQILHRRPDLCLVDIRGNVETRLRKLAEQGLDGLILAQAGLERLGLEAHIGEVLDPAWMLPAVGQGALGLECRADDQATRSIVELVDHLPTRLAVLAERALLRTLGGGCQLPIGAAVERNDDQLTLRGVVLTPDGRLRCEEQRTGPAAQAEELGQQVADALLRRGAAALLAGGA